MDSRNCLDVFDCLREDHESLKGVLERLCDPELETRRKRAMLRRFLPLYQAYTFSEEQSLLEECLRLGPARPLALEILEEHESAEASLHRISLAADDDYWRARVHVFCRSMLHYLEEERTRLFPLLQSVLPAEARRELGGRYLELRNKHQLPMELTAIRSPDPALNQTGKLGYLLAWILGVPAWVLLLVFLIKG